MDLWPKSLMICTAAATHPKSYSGTWRGSYKPYTIATCVYLPARPSSAPRLPLFLAGSGVLVLSPPSLHSSLFRFLLAGESDSQEDVSQRLGTRAKVRSGGRGWEGKEKPAAEPIHFTETCSSTNGRQLGIMIGQPCMSTTCQ